MTPIDIQVSRSKVKVNGHASLPHCVQWITQEQFASEASNLVGRYSLLSPRNALRWGYSNAAVVPSVRACVVPSFRPSEDLVNTIETKPLHISLSNLADMFTMIKG